MVLRYSFISKVLKSLTVKIGKALNSLACHWENNVLINVMV